jgi:hypothetical protein
MRHRHRPASLRVPGVRQKTWVTRRVSSSGHCLFEMPGGLAMPVVERIRKCGLHHSLGLRAAANFIVNVT